MTGSKIDDETVKGWLRAAGRAEANVMRKAAEAADAENEAELAAVLGLSEEEASLALRALRRPSSAQLEAEAKRWTAEVRSMNTKPQRSWIHARAVAFGSVLASAGVMIAALVLRSNTAVAPFEVMLVSAQSMTPRLEQNRMQEGLHHNGDLISLRLTTNGPIQDAAAVEIFLAREDEIRSLGRAAPDLGDVAALDVHLPDDIEKRGSTYTSWSIWIVHARSEDDLPAKTEIDSAIKDQQFPESKSWGIAVSKKKLLIECNGR
jgi:hypothetical protein